MNRKIILVMLLFGFGCNTIIAQSTYERIETRFTKSQLNKLDSLAFRQTAKEKLNQLIAYSRLYVHEETNNATKEILKKKASAMFRTNSQTGLEEKLDMDSLLLKLASVMDTINMGNNSAIKWIGCDSSFGKFRIANESFELKVLLIRSPKNFGKNEEYIWQVYFCQPKFNP
tara:strand:+ start:35193 stop:35708 length:516 start_codon:yes stop_codon:yes gene_type:complete